MGEPTALEEQTAYVWTLCSQARVGSYQHELSSGPWMILAAEQAHLENLRKSSSSTPALEADRAMGEGVE